MTTLIRGWGPHRAVVGLGALTVFAIAGCAGDRGGPYVTTVDSAGVWVTTITAPIESFGPYLRVPSEPVLSIGAVEGEGPEQFGRIGWVGGLRDGSVLVIDRQQSGEIRRFDASGRFSGTLGRQGEGPGEFRFVWDVIYADDDSLWISDTGDRRVSVFDVEGNYGRSFRVQAMGGLVLPMARLSGGGLMGLGPSVLRRGLEGTIDRTERVLFTFSGEGRDGDTVAVLPALEYVTLTGMRPLIFGRDLFLAVVGDRVAGGPNDRFELGWWAHDGSLTAITRFPSADVPVSATEMAEIVDEQISRLGGIENIRPADRPLYDIPPPSVRPAFGKILSDAEDRLWVGVFEPWPHLVTHWWIFASDDSAPLGYVDTPEGLAVHHIDEYGVLGVETDELGVEYVRRYALMPPR